MLLSIDFYRQAGQGGVAETQKRDLRAQLLEAEAAHFAKTKANSIGDTDSGLQNTANLKRRLEGSADVERASEDEEDLDAKRRRILEETRDIDADSNSSEDESSEEAR